MPNREGMNAKQVLTFLAAAAAAILLYRDWTTKKPPRPTSESPRQVFCAAYGFGAGAGDKRIELAADQCDDEVFANRTRDFCAKWPKTSFFLHKLDCDISERGEPINGTCTVLYSSALMKCDGLSGKAMPDKAEIDRLRR